MLTGLYFTFCLILAIYSGGISQPVTSSTQSQWATAKRGWTFKRLTNSELQNVSCLVSMDRLQKYILPAMMVVRPPGSWGSRLVQQIITNITGGILGWTMEYDTFEDTPPRPYTSTRFTNIIATHNPNAKRRLVLACHYDSKITPKGFLGATDSAVPCSMMIEIAIALRNHLSTRNDVTLELIFFDGEEAFVKWSDSDSLYGSRHLANEWQNTPWPPLANTYHNRLDSIDLLLLLDLLGAPNPKFYNSFAVQSTHFNELRRIERKLYGYNAFFQPNWKFNFIQDDHLPFYRRGVPILHVISSPFPAQWHTIHDNLTNLDFKTIEKLTQIFAVFVAEYLHLDMRESTSKCA